jgi:hypothetical protein
MCVAFVPWVNSEVNSFLQTWPAAYHTLDANATIPSSTRFHSRLAQFSFRLNKSMTLTPSLHVVSTTTSFAPYSSSLNDAAARFRVQLCWADIRVLLHISISNTQFLAQPRGCTTFIFRDLRPEQTLYANAIATPDGKHIPRNRLVARTPSTTMLGIISRSLIRETV